MAFDAGTIIAHLDLDAEQFDRKLREREAAARRAENIQQSVKLGIAPQEQAQFRRQMEQLDRQVTQDAIRRGNSGQGSLLATLLGMSSPSAARAQSSQQAQAQRSFLSRLTGSSGGGGGESSGGRARFTGDRGFGTGLLSGIGPGILGIGTRLATVGGLGASALGALPALAGIGGVAGIGAVGAGFIGLGAKELIGTKNVKGQAPTEGPLFSQAQAAMKSLQSVLQKAADPLIAPLRQAFRQIPELLQAVGPALRQAFAGAGTLILPILHGLSYLAISVLPLLGKAFRAAAPLIEPLLVGLGHLLTGILPGLISLLQAARPAITVFAQVMTMIGGDLGRLLQDMAPAIRASSVIFRALAGVIGALLPVVGRLAAIFASALAPVFSQLAGVIRALMPTLIIVGKLFASLAGAILGDLVSAFTALARLIVAISPALAGFAKAFSGIFTVLENSGVFAVLGDTLEQLTVPLGKLISQILHGLTPILPPLIKFIGQLASMLAAGLAQAITALLPPLSKLALAVLGALVTILPVVLPLLLQLTKIFTGAVVRAVSDLALALAAVLNAIPPSLLSKIVIGILAIVAAVKAWGVAMAIVTAISDANPIGLIALAVAGLVIGITELVRHWNTVWNTIKQVASDAWHFIYDGFGKFLLPLLGPAGLIALGVIELAQHWKQIWGAIKQVALDFNQWIVNDFGHSLTNFFTQTIPNVLHSCLNFFRNDFISPVENALAAAINWVQGHFVAPMTRFLTQSIPAAFRQAVSAIRSAWTAVEGAVRAPVNWVITHVINDGLIHAFDWISSKVGGPHIADVPTLAAGGLITKGTHGTADDVLARVSKGETVVSERDSKILAPIFAAMGIPGYAAGGIPGAGIVKDIGHAIAKGAKAVFHGFGTAARVVGDLVGGGGKILAALATGNQTALINAIRGLIPGGVGGAVADMAELLTDIPKTLVHLAVQKLLGLFGGGSSAKYTGKFGAGVAQWRGDVETALRMLGLPLGLTNQVLFQMNTESGGNPNAINLTDSNAAAGDPSRGLLQTIMTTFEAYRSPALPNNIYNPLANIYAAINYARHVYGPTLMRGGMGLGSGHGYDSGGWLQPGGQIAWNLTGRKEAVLTPAQSEAFLNVGEAARMFTRGTGTASGSALMRDVYLSLPEGTTVAQALAELTFRLKTAQQSGYVGMLP